MVPSVAATAAIGVGLAQGALAASFAVSGQDFKVRAGHLHGEGFAQYGGIAEGYESTVSGKKVKHPVAISSFDSATITNMCQSVVTDVPMVGKITLKLTAGDKGTPVQAKNLFIDVAELDANAKFKNIDIGVALSDKSRGPEVRQGDKVLPHGFAQQAESADLTNVEQRAWATTAGTFELSGLSMRLSTGTSQECY
jgi:hypothetical protein